jgi:LmbE family N-acetylglucosaminyl deacetylase
MTPFARKLLFGLSSLAIIITAAIADPPTLADPNAMDIYLDRGSSGLSRCLAALRTRASILMVTAHPDDEDGGMLALQTRGLGARGMLLTLTRGEGGQNAMTNDMYDAMGLMRTQELLAAGRYYGVDQYWGRAIDYGFSKTREEALEKWGADRTLSDVVRVIRMTRPLIVSSVFIGAPTDGHGNHQVAGEMAQEAFVAAGDPNKFPEQLREGLRPWSPLKVYERVPNFARTKQNTIYDYATDKYVPIRFYDYINKTWLAEKPAVNVTIPVGKWDPATGLTFLQIGRQGWGFQKSQNGGGTLPLPSIASSSYHRYGSRVAAASTEASFYDGIDVSLSGIASLATGDTKSLKDGLARLSAIIDGAVAHYRPESPGSIAPELAKGLTLVRNLVKEVEASGIPQPGKDDVVFELQQKDKQFQKALTLCLGVSFDAVVAPEKEPTGPFAAFANPLSAFTTAIPGQTFAVQASLLNEGAEALTVEKVSLEATDGKNWSLKPEASPKPELASAKELRMRFAVKAADDAKLTRPYFFRPNEEQPYYDVSDNQYRNLSVMPYPLQATARVVYQGADLEVRKVVQSSQRIEGIGIVQNPLIVGPAVSVSVSPSGGAIPLTASSLQFSCTLHSNVKGEAKGTVRLKLPPGWKANPPEYQYSLARDGENETVAFQVSPQNLKAQAYDIRAEAEWAGKAYSEGYRLVGYPGLRPYPYYRPATYVLSAVDVKTAPSLRIGYLPGTGDDVARALQDLGLQVQILTAEDIESADLSRYDTIVLGVRAYAVRPELRAANNRLLNYVKNGGTLVVQYNLQNFDREYGPYPFTLGSNPQKVVDEFSPVKFLDPSNPLLTWPNRIEPSDFQNWQEERGHSFMEKWDPRYTALVQVHDPDQDPQSGGLLIARYGKGFYVYNAFALHRQLPAGVPGAYRLLANLVSLSKNPEWH